MAQADLRVSVILIAVNVRFGVADCLTLNGSNRPILLKKSGSNGSWGS
jgi:hypothetical protein